MAGEADAEEPDDAVRYDLAGNPLPSRPSQAAPPPVPGPSPAAPPSVLVSTLSDYTRPAAGSSAPPSSPTPPRPLWLYLGLGTAAAVIVLALIFGLRALKPTPVTAPAAYKTYTALDHSFSCDGPVGWKMGETGSQGGSLSTVSFEQGKARVKVVSDAAGSLLSESFNSANANLPPAQQTPPVEKLHEMDKAQLADSLTEYSEQPAQKIQTPFGDSRVSEWTATDGSGPLHGYRATMLGREREITVLCLAPQQNWTLLQPAFQRIISSVTPGSE